MPNGLPQGSNMPHRDIQRGQVGEGKTQAGGGWGRVGTATNKLGLVRWKLRERRLLKELLLKDEAIEKKSR